MPPTGIVMNNKCIHHANLAQQASPLPSVINILETKVFVEHETGT